MITDSVFKFHVNKLIRDVKLCVSGTGPSNEPIVRPPGERWMHIVGGWRLPQENFCTWRKHCPNATSSTTVHAWVALGLNPIICGEKSAIDSLNHVMAHKILQDYIHKVFVILHDSLSQTLWSSYLSYVIAAAT
jgi:hypothetical protein